METNHLGRVVILAQARTSLAVIVELNRHQFSPKTVIPAKAGIH